VTGSYSRALIYLLSYQAYRDWGWVLILDKYTRFKISTFDWWWFLILYKYTRFKLSTFRNLVHCSTCWAIAEVYRDWWWVLIRYKYTRFKLSTFRNLVHCSTCWAIKSTEIGVEFLSFISSRYLNYQPSLGIFSTALYLLSYQVYRDWWWVLILYKYTRFKLSTFRNLFHCSTCRAIKSTEIGHEFL
jgi:hypothetical protein